MEKQRNVGYISSMREGQRRTIIKIRKKSFVLRRRNEYGTFTWSEGRMTSTTSLYREMSARVRLRLALDRFSDLKSRGMLRWEAYRKHRVSINTALRTIGEAIMRLRKRRVEAGLFYLVPQADRAAIQVRTHLFSMPLKEALRKRRLELRKKKQLLDAYNNSQKSIPYNNGVSLMRASVKRLLLYTLTSVVLGCAIVLF
ncbi:hypothetical protein VPH35_030621 [Triticum aestivum]|uniref:uncharacterized protein n=1 Tax=Triticum aestivum TaxID=4565 RepID=UPI0008425A88|nr:uncharacterized protein LOC123041776 [Triticum aestivum]